MFQLPERKDAEGLCTVCAIEEHNERLKTREEVLQAKFDQVGRDAARARQ